MPLAFELSPEDWQRIYDGLRYLGRDLLWEEMDRCPAMAEHWPSAQAVDPNGTDGGHGGAHRRDGTISLGEFSLKGAPGRRKEGSA